MEFKDYVKFANENPASYVVTVEGDQPLVRDFLGGVLMTLGFFHTGAMKPVHSQLKQNPKG